MGTNKKDLMYSHITQNGHVVDSTFQMTSFAMAPDEYEMNQNQQECPERCEPLLYCK